jgi:phosphatidylinositol-3-phosphatase
MPYSRHWSAALLSTVMAGCAASTGVSGATRDGGGTVDAPRSTDANHQTRPHDAGRADAPRSRPDAADASCGSCPDGYQCGTANGLPVCRAPSGIPMFSHVFIIMEENTSLSTLMASMTSNAAPNFENLRVKYASGTNYHGVSHPSLPNYIALTSGGTQGVGCDCEAQPGQGSCDSVSCNLVVGDCTCMQSVKNLADQLETAGKTWGAFGEGMGEPCNDVDDSSTSYAVRHVPFLYYDDILGDPSRCMAHVVDYTSLSLASPPDFTYIAPNLIDDMHNPTPATQENITDGDDWIGPEVAKITASSAYQNGGLLVIVWDEDDDSGGITGTNDPIPIFVLSPYAKSGGYSSVATYDHYSLLASIDDAFDIPRLGSAATPRPNTADTLSDFFPDE